MEAGRRFITDIISGGIGSTVDEVFSVRRKETPRKTSNGKWFFSFLATDATGEIKVNYWGGLDEAQVRAVFDSVKEGGAVRVRATSNLFKEDVVLQVNPPGGELRPAMPDEIVQADLLPCTRYDPGKMMDEVMENIASIKDDGIRAVLDKLFSSPRLAEEFRTSPAAVSYHCAWTGGLLEHTLNVVRICDNMAKLYPRLDRDLLIAGAILHDIGKVRCYAVTTTITESADGMLMGHIPIGAMMVGGACDALGTDPVLKSKLLHMVLASHGEMEKGSPVRPCLPEAMALSFADQTDAMVERYINARDSEGDEMYAFDKKLGIKIFKG